MKKASKTRRAFRPFIWSRFRGSQFHGNVVLNFTRFPKGELSIYARAYHVAAQQGAARLASKRGYRDVDACPIVFLYRHSLELYLKSLIHWGNALLVLNNKAPVLTKKELFRTHSLLKLIEGAKPVFKFMRMLTNWQDPEYKSFKHVEKIVGDLENIDPGSYSFRYPINRKGGASLPGHFCFNVIEFAERLDRLLGLLDGADTSVYLTFQSQAEAIYDPSPG